MRTTIEADYRAVTPVFCSGADPNKDAELRLSSFKGILRFWWRALAWSKYGGDLSRIGERENSIFGSASGGQSRLLMRLASADRAVIFREGKQLLTEREKVVGEGCRYLGYGLMETFGSKVRKTVEGQLIKSCIIAPYQFTVSCLCRDIDEQSLELVCDALKAIGIFGGIGARSRRGYGSLVLSQLRIEKQPVWQAPSSADGLKESISSLLREYASPGLPEYTALSQSSRCIVLQVGAATPLETLNTIGREMIRYRSHGRDGRVLGRDEAESNFSKDHDLMQTKGVKSTYPKRIAFGLPQNYFFSSTKTKSRVTPAERSLDRRASPLFIHVHSFDSASTQSAVVMTFLPARFLPVGGVSNRAAVSVDGSIVELPTEGELYEPIHRFLNRLVDPRQRKEPFSAAEEISI